MVFPFFRGLLVVPKVPSSLHSSGFIKEDAQHREDQFLHPAPPPLDLFFKHGGEFTPGLNGILNGLFGGFQKSGYTKMDGVYI